MNIKESKLTVPFALKLASIPRPRCAKCNSIKSYTNPMAKCFECKKRFCYDDINSLQVNAMMKESEEVRHICDKCKEKYEYERI